MKNLLKKVPARIIYFTNYRLYLEPKTAEGWDNLASRKGAKLLWFSLDVLSEDGKQEGWNANYGVDGISYISSEAKDPEDAIKGILKLIEKYKKN